MRRILRRADKANSSPPRVDPYSDRHRPDPDFDGYCWCGKRACDENGDPWDWERDDDI
jgi:hypothetical protein